MSTERNPWPALYALSFSGFYLAMFLVLFALILRPVGFKYRSKRESIAWRRNWDWALFVGGAVPALIFGVAVGNALASPIQTPGVSWSSPEGFATEVPGSEPIRQLLEV